MMAITAVMEVTVTTEETAEEEAMAMATMEVEAEEEVMATIVVMKTAAKKTEVVEVEEEAMEVEEVTVAMVVMAITVAMVAITVVHKNWFVQETLSLMEDLVDVFATLVTMPSEDHVNHNYHVTVSPFFLSKHSVL
jgi:hypothetical protein